MKGKRIKTFHIFLFWLILMLFLAQTTCGNGHNRSKYNHNNVKVRKIGAILDKNSRIGKEEMVGMEIAVEDIYHKYNLSLVLDLKDSHMEPLQAAFAAKDLIDEKVEAIIGLQTWEEASLGADIGSQNHIPILSFADTAPEWASSRWPYLLQASPHKYAQAKAIAAIMQTWNWHQVTLIYEDNDSLASGFIPRLSVALKDVGAEIRQVVPLSPFASSSSLSNELAKLVRGECRVFVVHLSLALAAAVFLEARKMKMVERDYVWITTDPVTSLVHSMNASTISSMQGVVGVKGYFPEKGPRFQDFEARFRRRFSQKHPEEDRNEPGIFAVQAYDAVWTMALAIQTNKGGEELLGKILLTNFQGLSGKVEFNNQRVASADTYLIINVVGRSFRELGFWSNELGFSETIEESVNYGNSMTKLGQVFWPGGPLETPKGWSPSTSSNPLRVGVPAKSGYKEYANVEYDHLKSKKTFSGLAIEVFKETVKTLPFNLPYVFMDFNGTYNELVQQIHLKKFDVVIGDVAVVSERYQHAEFTHPYTENELVMIVPVRSKTINKAWLFMKPFTTAMWVLVAVINIYNGFVVWLIERPDHPELRGSVFNQIGILLWLAFNTLFSLHGEKMSSNLSRMSMVVWLFVALIITQTYTANLTSMLTVKRLEPTIASVDELINTNAVVGYCTGSYLSRYLTHVLHFQDGNLRNYTTVEDYRQGFEKKEIAAAFLEAPLAKLFLAKYCKGYTKAGPSYKVGGFGFAISRGSPLLPSLNKALLKVCESGKLLELENAIVGPNKCPNSPQLGDDDGENPSLSPSSFLALFVITVITSTVALLVYVFSCVRSGIKFGIVWGLLMKMMRNGCFQKQRFVRRVSDSEGHGNGSDVNSPNPQLQV